MAYYLTRMVEIDGRPDVQFEPISRFGYFVLLVRRRLEMGWGPGVMGVFKRHKGTR